MAARSSTPDPPRRLALALLALACACGLPRDPEGTSERVASRGLRVGVVLDPPWACLTADRRTLGGTEVELVRGLARSLGVDVSFDVGGETRLLAALRRFELDLVIGGIVADSPHGEAIGLTRAYRDEGEHVIAVPPGENAWTMRVEHFLHHADVDGALRRGLAECDGP